MGYSWFDGIPVELFQILKDDAVKMLHSICQQIWKESDTTERLIWSDLIWCNIALYSIRPCFYHQSHPKLGVVFSLAPSLHSFWSYFSTNLQQHIGHLPTWGVPLSLPYHFAFSYCSWDSQGKNTEVVCYSLLQWTTFYLTSLLSTKKSKFSSKAFKTHPILIPIHLCSFISHSQSPTNLLWSLLSVNLPAFLVPSFLVYCTMLLCPIIWSNVWLFH